MVVDLNVTYAQLNNANSVNYVGLSMGCVLFIPLARKYGRRLVYLLSIALMFVTSIWLGRIQSLTELYIANLLQGLAGATNESLVQITVCHKSNPSCSENSITDYRAADRLRIFSLFIIAEE